MFVICVCVYIATVSTATPPRQQLCQCRQLELLRRCPRHHRSVHVHDLVRRWEMLTMPERDPAPTASNTLATKVVKVQGARDRWPRLTPVAAKEA